MSKLIDSTVRAVRRFTAGLRPLMSDDRGPAAAIDFTSRCGIDVQRHIIPDGNTAFSGGGASTLLRIVLKALSRADASLVALTPEVHGQHRVLRFADADADPGAPQSARPDKSFGLPGILGRAAVLKSVSRSIPRLASASPFPSRSSLTPSHPKRPLHDQSDHRRRPHARA
jgi:signal transduction histidine kinase